MKVIKLLALIVALLGSFQAVFAAGLIDETQSNSEVITKRKIYNDDTKTQTKSTIDKTKKSKPKTKQQKTNLPISDWNTLTTTNVPGIYYQKFDNYGKITNKYFFYNQITQKMLEIPNKTSISSTKDLGNMENNYNMYSNKSNTIMHNGKTYIIPSSIPEINRILAVDSWKYLRTTEIPGIFQMSCFCGVCTKQTDYAFYNTKTKQMVYIKTAGPISSIKDLGALKDDFIKYGNKYNAFVHNGEKYTIKK